MKKESEAKRGRPKKHDEVIRTNLVLTPRGVEMLDTIMSEIGATSRSEAIRYMIREKYVQLTGQPKDDPSL